MSAAPPVDLVHLARYTGGDEALNAEVLALFINQARHLVFLLEKSLEDRDATRWRHAAHALKGAAQGIGSADTAAAASDAEILDPGQMPQRAGHLLEAIRQATGAVEGFAAQHCAEPAVH